MSLKDDLLLKIKEEIVNDPVGIGYAGKTNAEIVKLLNSPQVNIKTVEEILAPPVTRILSGMALGPNAVTQQDIVDAMK